MMPITIKGTGLEEGAEDEKMAETEIARITDEWLRNESWETYPEVVLKTFPGRPDIVAERRGICQVLECKKSLNFSVVEQAVRWRLYSGNEVLGIPHLIWVVVQRGSQRRSDLLIEILKQYRIGLITIQKRPAAISQWGEKKSIWPQEYVIYREIEPMIQPGSRKTAVNIITELNPDMRIATPGARGGSTEYMTPFKRTLNMIKSLLIENPEKEFHIDHIIKYLNENGGHHYGSDKSARGAIPPHLDRLGYVRSRAWGCWFKLPSLNDVV